MRPRWDCMLRAVDCAAVDKNNALLLGRGRWRELRSKYGRDRPVPIKLLRLLHASRGQHLTTTDRRTLARAREIMPILPGRTPTASHDHARLEVVDNHRLDAWAFASVMTNSKTVAPSCRYGCSRLATLRANIPATNAHLLLSTKSIAGKNCRSAWRCFSPPLG